MTTEYVEKMEKEFSSYLNVYHICVPFKVTTCTSMFQNFWRPWEEGKEDIWVRDLPENAKTKEDFPFFKENMWDYEFQEKLSTFIHDKEKAEKTAVLVGIRTQESLHRWRAIHKDRDTYY
ncbi:phosphoadenosine phosphosulfate sulfurtransferase, partial [Streptococcus agalactiae]|nr:phosphoadenosine phosphosulfate sulfurtransferase [Streptococcus agalactiae]